MNDLLVWIKRRVVQSFARPSAATYSPPREPEANAGEYQLLYKYLRDRYASRVVLTFSEIEDLLGFALPEQARRLREWWGTDPVAAGSTHADSWTLARRTAVVNMAAKNVVFERQEPLKSS